MNQEIGVVRDERASGSSGWRVRLRSNSTILTNKFFADFTYGGTRESSFACAKKHRDEIASMHGIRTTRKQSTQLLEARKSLGLSQTQAAEIMGLPIAAFLKCEGLVHSYKKGLADLLHFCASSAPLPEYQSSIITDLFHRHGISQYDIAECVNVSAATVEKWASGTSTPRCLAKTILICLNAGMPIEKFSHKNSNTT